MHGPTYMANALATAVALLRASSCYCRSSASWRAQVSRIERVMREELAVAVGLPGVRDVRTLGAIAVIEIEGLVPLAAATDAALAQGVWLRPFRNLVYAMPPYVTSDEDLRSVARAMVAAAGAAAGRGAN